MTSSSCLARHQAAQSPAQLAGQTAPSRWRRDIDGLRAVAVGAVLIFHIAQSFLRGGYVGVDVFFVISGYLISGQILQKVGEGRFSIVSFYEHRLRRIFPAYAVVLAVVLVLVLAKSLPAETTSFGASLLAALASATNLYFWAQTGYFGVAAEDVPLIHTWSLAVEEQFYFVFPILVILFARFARGRLAALILLTLALSLAASIATVRSSPISAFYFLPTRAWELLLGTVLALGILPSLRSDALRTALAVLGLVLMVVPMVVYSPYISFPGLAALPPCLGAALLIYTGSEGNSLVARALSFKPLVFVGLISYSLYLWHWPLLVFQRTEFLLTPSTSKLVARGSVFVASFLCAVASWWLVERPIRNRALVSVRAMVVGSIAAFLALGAGGIALVATAGVPQRWTPAAVRFSNALKFDPKPYYRDGLCLLSPEQTAKGLDRALCLPDRPDAPTYILLGDSHAASLSYGLRTLIPYANILQITGVLCPPLAIPQPLASKSCPGLIDLALNVLPRGRKIDGVFLAARWKEEARGPMADWGPTWRQDLLTTVHAFQERGVRPVVIGPNQEYDQALPRLLAESVQQHEPAMPNRHLSPDVFAMDRSLGALMRQNGVAYVSLLSNLCPSGACPELAAPYLPFLFDSNHFVDKSSIIAARVITTQLSLKTAF